MTAPPPAPRYGSDAIVDLLASAGIDHVAFNPGATFRGIHDSLVNYATGGPRIVLCAHEAVSVAIAQGYAKAAGKPMAVLLHNVVGLLNASMAVYNAWCDRVPMLLLGGTGPLSKVRRRPWIDWIHTASVQGQAVRDFVKWDDQPHDLASVPESFARALHTTVSHPPGPVYLCYDADLQEQELAPGDALGGIAAYATPTPPAPAAADLDWLAGALRGARHPLLVAGYAGETAGEFRDLVELAERLHAPVIDTGRRMAFPTTHELNVSMTAPADGGDGPDPLDDADLVVLLDVDDVQGLLGARMGDGHRPARVRLVNVTTGHLRARGWTQDYQALPPAERHLTAAAGPAVAGLLERLRQHGPDPGLLDARRRALAGRVAAQRARWRERASRAHADGAVPAERLVAGLGAALTDTNTPFVLANGTLERLEHRLWDLSEPGQYLGFHGGGGLGYGLGAATGAALATPPGTVVVDVQADGDALFTPQALWTMAHLRVPVLVVLNNNRQYGNTVGHAERVARARGRPVERRAVGAVLTDPPVDFAALAASFGVWSAGPVTDADKLRGVLDEAVAVVRGGRPALVDVVTPGA